MNHEVAFDSIESAHEFLTLFAQVVLDTKRDIEAHLQREVSTNFSRRFEALQIIAYLLDTLEADMKKSCRILNDLRSLRRLLYGERSDGTMAVRPKSVGTAKARSSPLSPSPRGTSGSAGNGGAVARDANTYVRVKRRALSSSRTVEGNSRRGDATPWYVRQDMKPTDRRPTIGVP